MKRILMTAATAALFVSALAATDLKTFLLRETPKMEKAFMTGDVSYFEKISTKDFTMTEMGQTVDKKTSLDQMKQMNQMMKMKKIKTKLVSAVTKGNVGTAVTTMYAEATMAPMKKGDKSHKMVTEAFYTETWVRVGNGWKVQKIVATKPTKMLMDGKPFDPSKMGG